MGGDGNMNGAGNDDSQTASAETALAQCDASILTPWKYRPELMHMTADELGDLTTAHLCYTKLMAKPTKELEIRLGQLKCNGCCVQILDWPNSIKVDELHVAFEKIDQSYDKDISNLAGIKKMSMLQEVFESKDHVQITFFDFEIRICGENDECNICMHIGQQVRAPGTSKSDLLHKQILQFHTLPINYPNRERLFLPFEDAQKLVEKGMALEEQLKFLPKQE
eukprot:15360312-Ditylum_brightwellii.AAC.1